MDWKSASPEPLSGSQPPPPRAVLGRVEEVLGVRLPRAYKKFLARGNGGVPRVRHFLDGTTGRPHPVAAFLPLSPGAPDGVLAWLQSHGDRLPPGTLPVARDPDGNLLLLGVDDPWGTRVYLCNVHQQPEEDDEGNVTWTNVHPVARSFEELLERFGEVPPVS